MRFETVSISLVTNVFFSLVARSLYFHSTLCTVLPTCQKLTVSPRKPLMSTALPSYPWKRIAADLFVLKESHFLLVVDYYSRFIEIQKLATTIHLWTLQPNRQYACHNILNNTWAFLHHDSNSQFWYGIIMKWATSIF